MLGRPNVFTATERPGESLEDACAAAQAWVPQTHRDQGRVDSDVLESEAPQETLGGGSSMETERSQGRQVGMEALSADEEMKAMEDPEAQSDALAGRLVTNAMGEAPRLVYLLIGLASIFIIIFGIQASAFILNPILLAGVITIAVSPLPGKLSERGLPGWLALLLTILAVFGALGLVLVFVVASLGQLSAAMPTYAAGIEVRQQELTATLNWEGLGTLLSAEQLEGFAVAAIGAAGSIIFQLFITLFIFAFLLSATIALPSASRLGLHPDNQGVHRFTGFTLDVRQYLSTMTLINLLVGLGDALFLWIVGVDFALLWGILAWFLGYIPSIGFWLALIPPVILAWAQYGAPTALIVFAGYVLINGSVENIIKPRMMGERLKISPVVVFVSLFVWGWLLGGIGAILAVPLTMMILIVLDSFDATRWLVVLVRFSPEHTEGERHAALTRVKGVWGSVKERTGLRDEPLEDGS